MDNNTIPAWPANGVKNIEEFLISQGFYSSTDWGDVHWIRKINDEYCFWFSLASREYKSFVWGVAPIEDGHENIYESPDFKSFDLAYQNFVSLFDLVRFVNVVATPSAETLKMKVLVCPGDNLDDVVSNHIDVELGLDSEDYNWREVIDSTV